MRPASPLSPAVRRSLPARAPWTAVVVGAVLVLVGALLVARPLAALSVLGWYVGLSCILSGIGELVARSGADEESPRTRQLAMVTAAAWIVLGGVVVAWAGRSVGVLVPVVAAALIVSGGVAVVRLVGDRSSQQWSRAVLGVAELTFGLLALLWPDATLVVVAIFFGGRTALLGVSFVWRGATTGRRGHPGRVRDGVGRGRSTVLQWAGALLVLALAGGTAFVSHAFRDGTPVVDAFYDAPHPVPATPGELLRWDAYDGDVPAGMTGYRLLYVTTDGFGTPVPASAVLALPDGVTQAPLITWAHGTVGVTRACAPSLGSDAVSATTLPASDALARNGWAVVATDYPGMGAEGAFPYLIGEGQGRAVLDAARAARQLPHASLGDQTLVWGHSQGGHAALWAGQLADSYAPELGVVGTAALSPASDPLALAEGVLANPGNPGASLAVSFVVDAYTRYYPELGFDDVVAPSARTIVREAARRCTHQAGTLVTILAGLAIGKDQPIVDSAALAGPFGTRLQENVPAGPWPEPLLVAHGDADSVVPYQLTENLLSRLCLAGQPVELERLPGGDHLSVLADGSDLSAALETWTRARFAGEAAGSYCALSAAP